MPDRVRVLLDFTVPADPPDDGDVRVTGLVAGEIDGRRVYEARLTDSDEAEVNVTMDELTARLEELGVGPRTLRSLDGETEE